MSSEICQALRSDLNIIPQTIKGDNYYIVKDREQESYYRLSEVEHTLALYFDGKSTIPEIAGKVSQNENFEVSPQVVAQFYQSLKKMKLLVKTLAEKNIMLLEKRREARKAKLMDVKGSIIYMRIPFVDPDKFFDRIIDKIRWIWSKPAVFTMLGIMAMACLIIISNWSEVVEGFKTVYLFNSSSLSKLVIIYSTIFVVIGIHELGHGLTCKRYGGEVHEMGFLFLFFQPCLFCNVTDAWTFSEKKQRLYVTIAGVFIEFFVGACFVFVWYLTSSGSVINLIAYQIMMVCGISTALFNFNPLVKLDGYYAFCDWSEIPNLKTKSSEFLGYYIKTRLFKAERQDSMEFIDTTTKAILVIYGFLSMLYITSMLGGIFFMIRGILVGSLGLLGLGIWLYLGSILLKKFTKKPRTFLGDYFGERKEVVKKMKKATLLIGIIGSIGFLIGSFFISVPYTIPAKGYVEYLEKEILYAPVSGFIEHVGYAHTSDKVEIKLKNDELKDQLDSQLIARDKATALLFGAQQSFDVSTTQKIKRELVGINNELTNIKDDIKKLNIFSTYGGQSSVPFRDLNGKYVSKGSEILTVFNPRSFSVVLEVAERFVNEVSLGQTISFIPDSQAVKTIFSGKITDIIQKNTEGKTLKSYDILATIDADNQPLYQGLSGEAKIKVKEYKFWYYVKVKLTQGINPDLKLNINEFRGKQ
jgi:putative peptide zinc metalloprotease protein